MKIEKFGNLTKVICKISNSLEICKILFIQSKDTTVVINENDLMRPYKVVNMFSYKDLFNIYDKCISCSMLINYKNTTINVIVKNNFMIILHIDKNICLSFLKDLKETVYKY